MISFAGGLMISFARGLRGGDDFCLAIRCVVSTEPWLSGVTIWLHHRGKRDIKSPAASHTPGGFTQSTGSITCITSLQNNPSRQFVNTFCQLETPKFREIPYVQS